MNNEQSAEKPATLRSKLKKNIIAGLFIIIPVIATFWLSWITFKFLTDWAVVLIEKIKELGVIPEAYFFHGWDIVARILTIIVLVAVILFVGALASLAFGKKIISVLQKLLLKIPLLSVVYSTCEQIGETVKTQRGGLFKSAVMFEYPRKGSWAIGFVTSMNEEDTAVTQTAGKDVYTVFLPTTPNPTSGFLMVVPKSECRLLDMSTGDAMKLIVSCGVVFPEHKNETEAENS